jgi:hypothetical protein
VESAVAPAARKPRLDVPGLLLIAPGTSVLLLGLANAGTAAGFAHADVIIPLVVGAALLVAFTLYALRRSHPLVEMRLLAKRSVGSSSAVLFFSGFSLYGAMLLMPLYYQDVRGATALSAGVALVPQGVGAGLSRIVVGGNIDRFGSRVIALAGFVVVAAATVPFALAGSHTGGWQLAGWMVLRGFGLGAATMPVMVAGYIGLDKRQIPHSSVLTRTAQQIGGSFGTAVLAVILEGAIAAHPAAPVHAPCCSACGCPAPSADPSSDSDSGPGSPPRPPWRQAALRLRLRPRSRRSPIRGRGRPGSRCRR